MNSTEPVSTSFATARSTRAILFNGPTIPEGSVVRSSELPLAVRLRRTNSFSSAITREYDSSTPRTRHPTRSRTTLAAVSFVSRSVPTPARARPKSRFRRKSCRISPCSRTRFQASLLALRVDVAPFTFGGGSPGLDNYVLGKVDYQMNTNNQINVSYNFDQAKTDTPDAYNDKKSLNQSRTQRAIITFQHVFSPTVLNTLRTGASRINSRKQGRTTIQPDSACLRQIARLRGRAHGGEHFPSPVWGSRLAPGGLDVRGDTYHHYFSPQVSDDLVLGKRARNNIRVGGSFERHQHEPGVGSTSRRANGRSIRCPISFRAINPAQYNQDFHWFRSVSQLSRQACSAPTSSMTSGFSPNLTVNLGNEV